MRMRSSPRPAPYATAFLLLTYALLSAVPFVPDLLGKPIEHPWQVALIEALAWALAWSVFKRPAWFHWLLLPAFLALPTELYLFAFYGQASPPTTSASSPRPVRARRWNSSAKKSG